MAALNSRTIRVQTIGRYQKYFDLGSLSSRIRKPAGLHTGLTMPYHVYQHMRGPRQVVSEHPQHQPAARDPGSKGSSGPLKEDKLPQYFLFFFQKLRTGWELLGPVWPIRGNSCGRQYSLFLQFQHRVRRSPGAVIHSASYCNKRSLREHPPVGCCIDGR